MMESTFENEKRMSLTEMSALYLAETSKWAKFLSIVGFVSCGIMLLGGLFLGLFWSVMPNASSLPSGFGWFFALLYMGVALLIFIPLRHQYRFSIQLKDALLSNNQDLLEESFRNLKSYYRFNGIVMIVMLGLYALAIVTAILGGLIASFM
jgi:hypothetical protein